jgi:hypothetical protein
LYLTNRVDIDGDDNAEVSTATAAGFFKPRENALGVATNGTERFHWDEYGNIIIGTGQLANAATDGFVYIPGTTSGAPSGVPTAYAGRHPMVFDDTNKKLSIHDGSAWNHLGGAEEESIIIACSDETTALTTGTGKVTFRMPFAMTVTSVKASLTTAQTSGSIFTVDINDSGSTILSTKLTIDNTEKTSTTAATAAVISDSALAADAEITIDIDQIGDGTAKGLKVTISGTRA